jgi:hypothetical protein
MSYLPTGLKKSSRFLKKIMQKEQKINVFYIRFEAN